MMGLLGQWGQAMQPMGDLLGQVQQPIADNRNALMALGAGLMSGPMSTGMPDAMKSMMSGALVDQRRRAMELEQIEAERKRQAQLQMAKSLGLDPVFADSPSVLNAVAADRFKSKTPREQSFTERQFNMLTPQEQAAYRKREFLGTGTKAENAPSGYRYTADGSLEAIPGGPAAIKAAEGKPLTEAQGRAGTFASRALNSHQQLTQAEGTADPNDPSKWIEPPVGTNRTFRVHGQYADKVESGQAGVLASGVNALAAGAGVKAGVSAMNPVQQQVRRAEKDFITAVLRKESGAAISQSEFAEEYAKYFPQPGESPAVVRDKQKAREIAIQGMAREAGSGFEPVTGGAPRAAPRVRFDQYGNPM